MENVVFSVSNVKKVIINDTRYKEYKVLRIYTHDGDIVQVDLHGAMRQEFEIHSETPTIN